jgi:hypothetical protein
MLSNETTFPYPGSYALLIDEDAPPPTPDELVRINWRQIRDSGSGAAEVAMVSFPLREGASGNKIVPFAQLIDATPLTAEERREFHDLDRALDGRDPRNFSKAQRWRAARRDALRRRMVHAPVMERLLRTLRDHQARQRKAA